MLKFDVITLFSQLIEPHLQELPFKKAIQKQLISVQTHNLRDYAVDKHGTVDDKPYGGGVGMILRIEPVFKALGNIYGFDRQNLTPSTTDLNKHTIIVLTPTGKVYNQATAQNLAKNKQITFVCGRYEGIDARVTMLNKVVPQLNIQEISIGNFVLSGGELPALTIMESIVRLIPGVLEKEEATKIDSYSSSEVPEHEFPQYTRPEDFMGIKVPQVLLSGNHKEIGLWRKKS